jgi:hypothetical protein
MVGGYRNVKSQYQRQTEEVEGSGSGMRQSEGMRSKSLSTLQRELEAHRE